MKGNSKVKRGRVGGQTSANSKWWEGDEILGITSSAKQTITALSRSMRVLLDWKRRVSRCAGQQDCMILSSSKDCLEAEMDGEIVTSCGLARQVQQRDQFPV